MGTLTRVFNVSIPHTNRDFFDYEAGAVLPTIGARVWVPFRKKRCMGIVVGNERSTAAHTALKPIESVIDDNPLLSKELLSLCRWVSAYYQSPLSEVLPLVLPKKYRTGDLNEPRLCHYYGLQLEMNEALRCLTGHAPRQRALIEWLNHASAPLLKQTIVQAGFSTLQLNALVAKGILFHREEPLSGPLPSNIALSPPLPLNAEQAIAVDTIRTHLKTYGAFLLQGVTGSGKTEVYLHLIADVLAAGQQVLVLVPEIGLTPQLLARFRMRFNEPMAVIHSSLTDEERQLAWQWAKDGVVKLVIGTRAAVFTPLPHLGLIVIDEEHDSSLKQMEGVRYSARDTALMRAHAANIPIVLGSATPSLESLHNASLNKYTLLRLNQKALNSTPLHYQVIDLRNQALVHGLAAPTLAMIGEHLSRQNQVLVFINRRGFAPVLLCHQCGWMADCHACDAHLTLHRRVNKLMCHHCGLVKAIPQYCSSCKGGELLPVGTGTQRVYEYLSEVFPTTNVLRIDRDEVRKKNALDKQLAKIHAGDAQLMVGTQMLAKGHHFPRLTLVVVLDVDNGFYNQDFRALEQLGQLLTQVAGRAGRAEHPGTVVIQTHLPQHPMLMTLVQQGYDAFAQALLASRQTALLPPYYFLTVIRAQGKTLSKVLAFLHAVKTQLAHPDIDVLGPAPAPLAKKAGDHRLQLLVKSPSRKKLRLLLTAVRHWLAKNKVANGVRWNMDVDPMDLS